MRRQRLHLDGQLLQQVGGPRVAQRVHRVEAQAVDVEVAQPHQRVVDHVAAHRLGQRAVEVDRGAPDVAAREVGAEAVEVGAGRAEVVVDDVQHHAHAAQVAGVHEPLERVRAAVVLGDGVPADAVVAPVAGAVDGVHRQHFDEVHAQLGQVVEPSDRGVERARLGERADVQLVEHAAGQLAPRPRPVGPEEGRLVVELRRAVHAVGLAAGAGVGQRRGVVVEQVGVAGARGRLQLGPPPARPVGRHRVRDAVELYPDPVALRCPHREVSHAPILPYAGRTSSATG